MSKRTEFWLWWFTDESGRRRRTSFRMSREDAVKRYPDAEPIPGTLEIRNLSGTGSNRGNLAGRVGTTNRASEGKVAGSDR